MKNGIEEFPESGTKIHWKNDSIHCELGPAIEGTNGFQAWYIDGVIHRLDGPAIIKANGTKEWWINGKQIKCRSQKEFKRLVNNPRINPWACAKYSNQVLLIKTKILY